MIHMVHVLLFFFYANKNKLKPLMERQSRFNVRHLCFCIIYAYHGDIEFTNIKLKGLIHDLRFVFRMLHFVLLLDALT